MGAATYPARRIANRVARRCRRRVVRRQAAGTSERRLFRFPDEAGPPLPDGKMGSRVRSRRIDDGGAAVTGRAETFADDQMRLSSFSLYHVVEERLHEGQLRTWLRAGVGRLELATGALREVTRGLARVFDAAIPAQEVVNP
jgi:hypothetical protein